ncbi:MAG TPA: GreA/GreB family elongation factor [Longimicrobiaceae bacterium]|nr:GreA/GreB family elongation factor [Longimicrobiaceae bacterium]
MLAELRNRLGDELERLSHELTVRIPDELASSQAGPTLETTLELERVVQRRVRLLGQLVAGLAAADPRTIWPDRAGYGSTVRVRDIARGDEETYTLLTGDLIDPRDGQISLASPIGNALLGRRAGEEITVITPWGARRYEILLLATLPQKLGVDVGEPDARRVA